MDDRPRKTSLIAPSAFPPARGDGFATVMAVVEHRGVADSGLGLRAQLSPDQSIASADNGALHILYGKTENARRTIPTMQRVAAQFDMRQTDAESEWMFPARTATGHIEKSTLKKQHMKALAASKVEPFTLYTFHHTCLTRWPQQLLNHAPLRPPARRHQQSRH